MGEIDPGEFALNLIEYPRLPSYSLNLVDGTANLTVTLPDEVRVGDRLEYTAQVDDNNRALPFSNQFTVRVVQPRKQTGGGGGGRTAGQGGSGTGKELPTHLAFPNVIPVYRRDWGSHDFDGFSTLKVIDEGEDIQNGSSTGRYTFYINMDNQHLLTELKQRKGDVQLVRKHWEWGLVLIGLGLIRHHTSQPDGSDPDHPGTPLREFVDYCTRALSPIIVPLVESIASIEPDQTEAGYDEDADDESDEEEES